jgi:hypothetical protein
MDKNFDISLPNSAEKLSVMSDDSVRDELPARRVLPSGSAPHLPLADIDPQTEIGGTQQPPPDSLKRPLRDLLKQTIDNDQRSPDSPARRRFPPPSPSAAEHPYAQKRQTNKSVSSLSSLSSPGHRELIRSAISMLCKEFDKIPPHMSKSEAGIREWREVKIRTRALVRLERIWGKGGEISGGSTSTLSLTGELTSSGLGAGGEGRERRLLYGALKDGLVLCQCV